MVSVIVPIYNVESYLEKCIDSVINQTFTDLEIILIDDGSTDGCGRICDEYKLKDKRIIVYHTENRGLSAARNFGIEKSHGEYLYFIDSDDWIESNLIEQAMEGIGKADIICFGKHEASYSGFEALCALINDKIHFHTWNKLYKKECFSSIRFPEGRIMEDIATTYKLLHQSNFVVSKIIRGYHHIYRENSLAHTYTLKNIFDFCLADEEQLTYCEEVLAAHRGMIDDHEYEELYANLLKKHAYAIARAWGWRYNSTPIESPEWDRLSQEARTKFPYKVRRRFPARIRGGLFLARINNPLSFWIAHKIHVITRMPSIMKKKCNYFHSA